MSDSSNHKTPVTEEIILEMEETKLGVSNAGYSLEPPVSDKFGDVQAWISSRFTRKECTHFVPAKSTSKQRCTCGLLKMQHEKLSVEMEDENWSSKRHTEELPTNAFGYVSFSTVQQDTGIPAEYIRFSDTTSPTAVLMLMNKIWDIKSPNLLLSIIGGHREGNLTKKIRESLEKGLKKVVESTDVWLFTGASSTRINDICGTTFNMYYHRERSHRNICVGIFPWGCVEGKEQLLGEMANVVYEPFDDESKKSRILERHHTHFLLVDDGSTNKYGIERTFRAKLEKHLCSAESRKAIPTVNLLIGGGYTASTQIKQNMFTHPNIPIVVLNHSGGLADVIVEAYASHKEKGLKGYALVKEIRSIVGRNLVLDDENNAIEEVVSTVKEAVEEHANHIFIFDCKDDPFGLHHAIFQACKATCNDATNNNNHFSTLQLAIRRDEMELLLNDAGSDIINTENLYAALYKALKGEKTDFVQFLFEYGINLDRFLDNDRKYLKKLYAKKVTQHRVLTKMLTDGEISEFNKNKKQSIFNLEIVDRLLWKYLKGDYSHCYSDENFPPTINPYQELIIWASLNNMDQMVHCLWKQDTKHALENALLVFRLFKAMSKSREFDETIQADMTATSLAFEKQAVELLSLYYHENRESAIDIIRASIPLWGHKSLLTLAANAGSRDFVSHSCCQRFLDDLWHGKREKKTVKNELKRLEAQFGAVRQRAESAATRRRKKYAKDLVDAKNVEEREAKCARAGKAFKRFFWFFFMVPQGKLLLHAFLYTIFLGCFSFLVLVKRGSFHSIILYVVLVAVTSLAVDELRQLLEVRKRTLWLKILEWQSSIWNKLDFIAITLFFIGFGFSFFSAKIEKIILAVDLVMWIAKFTQFYRMFKTLGPYLIMMYRMMFHMIGFVLVLIIVVVAYGIFMHTLLFPEVSISWKILFKVLFRPYLLVFGELGISSYNLSDKSTVYGTKKVDVGTEIVVVIGMSIYLLMANVLMLNMLIAVFNNIYEDVKQNSDKIWKYDRYDLIMEFKNKPCLPVPVSIITNIPRVFFHMCSMRVTWIDNEDEAIRLDIEDFKHRCMRKYLEESAKRLSGSIEDNLKTIIEGQSTNTKMLLEMEEKFDDRLTTMQKQMKKFSTNS